MNSTPTEERYRTDSKWKSGGTRRPLVRWLLLSASDPGAKRPGRPATTAARARRPTPPASKSA
eukprot:13919985-Alexandrium_andersonii.AAC.1